MDEDAEEEEEEEEEEGEGGCNGTAAVISGGFLNENGLQIIQDLVRLFEATFP